MSEFKLKLRSPPIGYPEKKILYPNELLVLTTIVAKYGNKLKSATPTIEEKTICESKKSRLDRS